MKPYNCAQTNDYYLIKEAIWNHITMYKLFKWDRNNWNHIAVSKLFVLNWNTWYYIVILLVILINHFS